MDTSAFIAEDPWIAATARAHRVAVYSQDSDIDELAVDIARIVRLYAAAARGRA